MSKIKPWMLWPYNTRPQIIGPELYEDQPEINTGKIYWDDPDIEKWGFSPICVVNEHSYSINSKPYGRIEFTF